jgi:hypothetical protein
MNKVIFTINLAPEVAEILRKNKDEIGVPYSIQIEKAILAKELAR